MPRTRRQKIENGAAIYHIMCRSISEVDLFKSDEDKAKYMSCIEECKRLYNFKVYAYCLMDNHVHIIIDSNGSDISKVMHYINFKYACYFNRKHSRHGHLFQDRYKSKIVDNNRYLIALSLYIHDNALDLPGYQNTPETYEYSSLAVYYDLKKDPFSILDKYFILRLFGEDIKKSTERYMNMIVRTKDISLENLQEDDMEFESEKTEYRSYSSKIRDFQTYEIIKYIAELFEIAESELYLKYQKSAIPAKALLVLLLRNLCNQSCKNICGILGNITSSRISKLSSLGLHLISNDERYKNIINEFISSNKEKVG